MTEYEKFSKAEIFLFGFLMGVLIVGAMIFFLDNPIKLNRETTDSICRNITLNPEVTSKSRNGNLVCEIPIGDTKLNGYVIIENKGR